MKIPEYVTREEVKRVCKELGIRDWTELESAEVEAKEAEIIRRETGGEALQVSVDDFQAGLEVELEHGVRFPDVNVTNNHPLLTGRIVTAHLKESLEYYLRLEIAELEGDAMQALVDGNKERLAVKYAKLLAARARVSARESKALGATSRQPG
jgi:hypothetical protein